MSSTKQVFQEIRKAKPKRLFIASDGPRTKEEKKKTDAVRKYVLDNIDWECKIEKLFRDDNLGCKHAVAGAIDWFFENVEMGIILEDDCVPSNSFFRFCQEMLKKYKDDERVMHITGSNIMGKINIPESYFFFEGGGAWGWATWRRAWNKYDIDMKMWPRIKKDYEKNYLPSGYIHKIKSIKLYDALYRGEMDTWDYQWGFACFINNGLGIVPKINLITNIGFNREGTHTGNYDAEKMSIPRGELKFPLIHSKIFVKNPIYRDYAVEFFNKGWLLRFIRRGFRFLVK